MVNRVFISWGEGGRPEGLCEINWQTVEAAFKRASGGIAGRRAQEATNKGNGQELN